MRLAASQPIEFVDPGGFYHLDELPCSYDERTYPDDPAFSAYVEGNDHVALSEVIRRAVPGILPTDVVQYAGYPEADDAVQAVGGACAKINSSRWSGDPRPLQGVWRFGPLETCGDAGIGTGDVTARRSLGLHSPCRSTRGAIRTPPMCAVAYVEELAYRLVGWGGLEPSPIARRLPGLLRGLPLPGRLRGAARRGPCGSALRLSPDGPGILRRSLRLRRIARGPLPGIGRRTELTRLDVEADVQDVALGDLVVLTLLPQSSRQPSRHPANLPRSARRSRSPPRG